MLLAAAPADAVMRSTKLPDGTCATTGGGRIVPIPGFPGESIDRRLLSDIRWLKRRYPIFITDGYSVDAVHAANGEHPLGLALDIVPDKAVGGTWAQITALALFAEPVPDEPVVPFRWVGYDGDAGHGRRNHLHLSWNHSVVNRAGRLARTVYTIRCPRPLPAPGDATGGARRYDAHGADDARSSAGAGDRGGDDGTLRRGARASGRPRRDRARPVVGTRAGRASGLAQVAGVRVPTLRPGRPGRTMWGTCSASAE